MNTSAPQMSDMDIHLPSHTRWSYYTSDARSEKVPTYRASPYHPTQQTPLPAHRSPPFTPAAPAVQTSLGVWEDDEDVYYSSEWPPVQEYLDLVRSTRRKVKASSEMVFALAALHVVHTPADVAHWILWRQDTYYHTADRVTAIALHQPPLIKSKIPWIGSREYKMIVNAYQEKYFHTYILKKWYPTDGQPVECKKRTLRSSGLDEDRPEMTVNQFFDIPDDDYPPSKKSRKSTRKAADSQPSPPTRRARLLAVTATDKLTPAVPTATVGSQDKAPDAEPVAEESSAPIPRSSTRTKRKVSPSTRTPRIISAPMVTSPTPIEAPSPLSDLSEPSTPPPPASASSSSHARNRSISQSSVDTLVEDVPESEQPGQVQGQGRYSSVDSAGTAVGESSSSKKRKAEALEQLFDAVAAVEVAEEQEESGSKPAERMTTRGLSAKKVRVVEEVESEKSQPSTRKSTPVAEPRPKSSRAKTKARKARA